MPLANNDWQKMGFLAISVLVFLGVKVPCFLAHLRAYIYCLSFSRHNQSERNYMVRHDIIFPQSRSKSYKPLESIFRQVSYLEWQEEIGMSLDTLNSIQPNGRYKLPIQLHLIFENFTPDQQIQRGVVQLNGQIKYCLKPALQSRMNTKAGFFQEKLSWQSKLRMPTGLKRKYVRQEPRKSQRQLIIRRMYQMRKETSFLDKGEEEEIHLKQREQKKGDLHEKYERKQISVATKRPILNEIFIEGPEFQI